MRGNRSLVLPILWTVLAAAFIVLFCLGMWGGFYEEHVTGLWGIVALSAVVNACFKWSSYLKNR